MIKYRLTQVATVRMSKTIEAASKEDALDAAWLDDTWTIDKIIDNDGVEAEEISNAPYHRPRGIPKKPKVQASVRG